MTSRWISLVPSPIVSSLTSRKILLRRVVLHEAVAAVDLDAVVGGLDRDFAREQLRRGRFARRARALIAESTPPDT